MAQLYKYIFQAAITTQKGQDRGGAHFAYYILHSTVDWTQDDDKLVFCDEIGVALCRPDTASKGANLLWWARFAAKHQTMSFGRWADVLVWVLGAKAQ